VKQAATSEMLYSESLRSVLTDILKNQDKNADRLDAAISRMIPAVMQGQAVLQKGAVCGVCNTEHILFAKDSPARKVIDQKKKCLCGKFCKLNGCDRSHECGRKNCKFGDKCLWKHEQKPNVAVKQAARVTSPDNVYRVQLTAPNGAKCFQNALLIRGSQTVRLCLNKHFIEDEKSPVDLNQNLLVKFPNNAEVIIPIGQWSHVKHANRDAGYVEFKTSINHAFMAVKSQKWAKPKEGQLHDCHFFAYDTWGATHIGVSSGTAIVKGSILEHQCEGKAGNCGGILTIDGIHAVGMHFGENKTSAGAKFWNAECVDDDLISFFTKNL